MIAKEIILKKLSKLSPVQLAEVLYYLDGSEPETFSLDSLKCNQEEKQHIEQLTPILKEENTQFWRSVHQLMLDNVGCIVYYSHFDNKTKEEVFRVVNEKSVDFVEKSNGFSNYIIAYFDSHDDYRVFTEKIEEINDEFKSKMEETCLLANEYYKNRDVSVYYDKANSLFYNAKTHRITIEYKVKKKFLFIPYKVTKKTNFIVNDSIEDVTSLNEMIEKIDYEITKSN